VSPLLNRAEDLVAQDLEKAEALNVFSSAFSIKTSPQESQALKIRKQN